MKIFKRFLCIGLCVIVLSVSVGSSYFDANRMEKVDAAEIAVAAGLSAEALYQICLFVGASVATLYGVGEVIDNQDAIAEAGKNFIDSCSTLPDGWLFNMTDMSGQSYVAGTEALQLIQESEWEVIEGGSPDNNNNDDDDDKDSWFKWPTNADATLASWLSLGAVWLYDTASNLYQKWVNGEELTEVEAAVFEPIFENTVDQNNIAKQWSGESFTSSGLKTSRCYNSSGDFLYSRIVEYVYTSTYPLAAYYYTSGNYSYLNIICNYKFNISYTCTTTWSSGSSSTETYNNNRNDWPVIVNNTATEILDYSISNIPIFSSEIDAKAYLNGTGDVTNALNYAKTYQVADWLSYDWAGVLIDPLVNIGLSLSQLIELCKALGIHAVGNNLTAQELADLISTSLPAVNPDLLPDVDPDPVVVPDPDLDPIYYPDKSAHPIVDPDSSPDTGEDSDTDKDKDENKGDSSGGGSDDGSNDDNSEGDSDDDNSGKWIVDLSKFFPFCIPYDLINLVSVLDADPVAPRWEVPFQIPAYGIDYTFDLDLSVFDDVAKIWRIGETLLFILGLILLTRNLIKG